MPLEVAFEMAQQASFLVLKSPFWRMLMSGGMRLASMTCWICSSEPAVMLEMVQEASLRMPSLGEFNRARRAGRALREMINCVWVSSPVTMFPTDLSAGV